MLAPSEVTRTVITCCRMPIITNNKPGYIKGIRVKIKEKKIKIDLGYT